MKIKIIEPGYESFNGTFGITEFKNGVSLTDVSSKESSLLSAIIRIETVDGDEVSQAVIDRAAWDRGAESVVLPTLAELEAKKTDAIKAAVGELLGPVVQQLSKEPTPKKVYSREELEALADKGGIAAVREVAEPLGVKGRGIAEIIDEIIAAQGGEVMPEPIEAEFVEDKPAAE